MSRLVAAALCAALWCIPVLCWPILCLPILGIAASPSRAVAQQKDVILIADSRVLSTVKDIMESVIDTSADVIWGAVGTVVDREGIHEAFPKTPEEWLEVRRAAIRIIEGGNLLMMPGREAAPVGAISEAPGVELEPAQITPLINQNRKSFDGFAGALQSLGVEALRASAAQDTASLLDIGARMESVCEGCHQAFWYPAAKPSTP
jgi:hypothetical protein